MSKNIHAERIASLRQLMKDAGIRAFVIPRTDAHMSEYIADHWHVVRWLSGFTGSAANMVVTLDKAMLWTDSRYFLQAAQQLEGSTIELMKEGLSETPSIDEWLVQNMHKGDVVGADGMTMSVERAEALAAELAAIGAVLDLEFAPFDTLWADRPALPQCSTFVHDEKYAGESAASKIAKVMEAAGTDAVLISALDEIAWILNLRSADVPCNPVATSFLYLAPQGSTLFIDRAKLTPEVEQLLEEAGVATLPYTSVKEFLSTVADGTAVGLSPRQTAASVAAVLCDNAREIPSPVAMLKAVKNEVQIEGIRQAMRRDGVALVYSFMEIERRIAAGERLTELDVADILTAERSKQPLYFEDSFETIAGFGPHGAIVHYSANEASNAVVEKGSLLLVDSGANYLDGTTDITRTVAVGEPTAEMRHDFTLVMKGHIAIAEARYPEGTRGHQLDAMARMPLWMEGKSYLHGTGHGVGHFLNVHEGPQSIRLNDTMAPLLPGMITSNEPGLYLAGKYGIRCENLVLTLPWKSTEFGNFLCFETLTLFPFDRTLFEKEIMSKEEIAWVDAYHAQVREALTPLLSEEGRKWLAEKTLPL